MVKIRDILRADTNRSGSVTPGEFNRFLSKQKLTKNQKIQARSIYNQENRKDGSVSNGIVYDKRKNKDWKKKQQAVKPNGTRASLTGKTSSSLQAQTKKDTIYYGKGKLNSNDKVVGYTHRGEAVYLKSEDATRVYYYDKENGGRLLIRDNPDNPPNNPNAG